MHAWALRADRIAFAALASGALLGWLRQSVQETCLVAAVLAWVAAMSFSGHRPARTGLEWPFLAWFAAAVLSLLVTQDMGASLNGLRKILKVGVLAFAAAGTIRTPHRIFILFACAAAGLTVASVDGLWQVAVGADPLFGTPVGEAPGGLPRLSATYPHANHFAIHGLLALPVFLVLARRAPQPWQRRAAWAGMGLALIALGFTFSRPGLVGAVAAIAVWASVARAWRPAAWLAAAAAAGALCLPAPIKAWTASQPSWFDAMVQPLRKEIWHAAWGMIQASPWIGQGVNTFVQHYAHFKLATDNQIAAYAHNNVLHMWAEIGALGLAAFTWLLLTAAAAGSRLVRCADALVRESALALACGLAAFLAIGLLESNLYSARSNFLFWVWLGAWCSPSLRTGETAARPAR